MIILVCLASSVLAQGTTGRTGSTKAPSSTLSPSTKATTNPSVSRTSNPPATQSRANTTSYGNSNTRQTTQDRTSRPAAAKNTRPSTYAPPTNATSAKGSQGKVKGVAPLKSAERGTVHWMSLEEALEKSQVEKRKIFVDMYTDWCGWCKHMDSTTFVNADVARYLNENFYPVKFNAEQENDIVFKEKTYKFKKNGSRGFHELAALWLNNRLSFPTVVFLDETQHLIQPVPGYQDAVKMEAIINYFGSDSHKKTPWESYEKNFSNQK